ncbi:MAG: cupredoxin domain-containing protein, partial [Actinomycetota bacterium]|nr:cupredoxin domain-containing protein [Actinomycetota bacterium]
YLVSRILLNVPKEIATAIALAGAFNILAACTYIALSSNMDRFQWLSLAGVTLLPVLFGGVAAAGIIHFPGAEGEAHEREEAAPTVNIAANNLAFDQRELVVPAGREFKLVFNNQEALPHNVAILRSQGSGEVLFREPPFTGPAERTYTVNAIPAGSYYFQCDVHPNMNGTVTAQEGAGPEAQAAEGAGTAVTIVSENLAFDKKEIQARANQGFKLTLDNKEPQPHNVAILRSQGSAEVLFRQPPFVGPRKETWDVAGLPAGRYYFQCDVHPNMNGTVAVS